MSYTPSIFSTTPTLFSDQATLLFGEDSPINTTITDSETEKVVYTVSTSKANDLGTVTTFKDTAGELIASSQWQPGVEEDLLTIFGVVSSVPYKSYFKKAMFKEGYSFSVSKKKKYIWKRSQAGLNVELYQEGTKRKSPIAIFTKSRRVTTDPNADPPISEIVPAKIVLDEEALDIRDLVVITLCLVEKARRQREEALFSGTGSGGGEGSVPGWSLVA